MYNGAHGGGCGCSCGVNQQVETASFKVERNPYSSEARVNTCVGIFYIFIGLTKSFYTFAYAKWSRGVSMLKS